MTTTVPGQPAEDHEVRRLLHELQVHQVELAQQNEELRSARGALEETLSRSVALFDFAPVALVDVDAAGNIRQCNRRALELLGPSARHGAWLPSLVAAESRDRVTRALQAAGDSGGADVACEVAVARPRADGVERHAELRVCRPQRGSASLLVALSETTERHHAMLARLAQERAEAVSRDKARFLSRMSHELRTPLNAVLGFSYLLERDALVAGAPAVLDRVHRIHEAGEHLLVLVDEVLDITRLEAGSLSLSLQDVDLDALRADVAAMLAPLAAQQAVTLALPAAGPTFVRADLARTRQVLINLLGNAIKFNRAGGHVELRIEPAADEIAIVVADDGPGLSAEQQAGLFQPFNRAGAERGPVAGIGLGLAITRQLVLAMSGRIAVRSTPGHGATFTVWLPRGRAVRGAAPVVALPPPLAAPLVVVYVEDNPVNAELMQGLMASRPHVSLSVADTAASGLALMLKVQPDLVLLDLHLPDRDGAALFCTMQQDARLAGIPCVAVSANALRDVVKRTLAAGFVDYLTKPVDVDRLFALIDRTAPRARRP